MTAPELLARIRGEYREMPGLCLTLAQACRLWHLDASTCEMALQTLVGEQFLMRTKNGAFVALPLWSARANTAKATLRSPAHHHELRRSA